MGQVKRDFLSSSLVNPAGGSPIGDLTSYVAAPSCLLSVHLHWQLIFLTNHAAYGNSLSISLTSTELPNSMVGFRGSTGGTGVSLSASLREQIARALQANLLLLHQPTPNAFVLLDPNPPSCHWVEQSDQPASRQRFRVTLGSQHCTCSAFTRSGILSTCPVANTNAVSPCVHVLFVMLRVLRLSLDDPRILKTSLENHEVWAPLPPLPHSVFFFLSLRRAYGGGRGSQFMILTEIF
ncbi:unnamed protein product [Schistocephalus solidus]|uniref:SWIM-type domain-containing protein n=1 Tax=Schistocephalus solidus TaxID=70667 RepID=A0A183S8Z0_SCHSO|nr:unnamed protein product [Schistocephalus solidus]